MSATSSRTAALEELHSVNTSTDFTQHAAQFWVLLVPNFSTQSNFEVELWPEVEGHLGHWYWEQHTHINRHCSGCAAVLQQLQCVEHVEPW
jgi:hypothetical protein